MVTSSEAWDKACDDEKLDGFEPDKNDRYFFLLGYHAAKNDCLPYRTAFEHCMLMIGAAVNNPHGDFEVTRQWLDTVYQQHQGLLDEK